jgi:hypothetical protein
MPLLRSVWSSGTISLVWGLAVRWEGLQNFCLLSAGHLEPDCHFAFLNVPRSKELESELGLGFWGRGGGCWQAVSGVVGVVVIPQLSSLLMLLVPSRLFQTFQSSSVWGDRSFGGVVALLAASGVVGVMGEVGFGV